MMIYPTVHNKGDNRFNYQGESYQDKREINLNDGKRFTKKPSDWNGKLGNFGWSNASIENIAIGGQILIPNGYHGFAGVNVQYDYYKWQTGKLGASAMIGVSAATQPAFGAQILASQEVVASGAASLLLFSALQVRRYGLSWRASADGSSGTEAHNEVRVTNSSVTPLIGLEFAYDLSGPSIQSVGAQAFGGWQSTNVLHIQDGSATPSIYTQSDGSFAALSIFISI